MPDVEKYFDEIDNARIRRAKELSELKRSFEQIAFSDPFLIGSKAVVVLAYANWEGFFNDCARIYLEFLREKGGRVRDSDWMLLVGALQPDFDSLRDRNHSFESKQTFVANLKVKLECGFDEVDVASIGARSNLDFDRLTQTFQLLSFDPKPIIRWRDRLDRELVGWRHAVAHGASPDLTKMDVATHVELTANLMTILSDRFQYAILERI